MVPFGKGEVFVAAADMRSACKSCDGESDGSPVSVVIWNLVQFN
jgi:hypothetical protein